MNSKKIIDQLPYSAPFLFVHELKAITDDGVVGSFTFNKELDFFRGHFKGNPLVPGVILTECCAQIGLVCLGVYLWSTAEDTIKKPAIALSSTQMEFYHPVYPEEKVTVHSSRIYYRFNKLKCKVSMYNSEQQLVCKGELAGMIIAGKDE